MELLGEEDWDSVVKYRHVNKQKKWNECQVGNQFLSSIFSGAWTPSFCEFTQNFSKTSTPPVFWPCLPESTFTHLQFQTLVGPWALIKVQRTITIPILMSVAVKLESMIAQFCIYMPFYHTNKIFCIFFSLSSLYFSFSFLLLYLFLEKIWPVQDFVPILSSL